MQPPKKDDQTPMPNTEALNDPIKRPYANYEPMAFGPIGRDEARAVFAEQAHDEARHVADVREEIHKRRE